MTEQQFEDLAKRWPDLFQKSGDFELSIGDGWYNIIDTLCAFLSSDVERARTRLKYALDNPDAKFVESTHKLEKSVTDALKNLPVIVQVKEKFGTLRFYVDGGTSEMRNYIEFAEAMSGRTCEVCGSPGERRGGGWIRTLCDRHNREQEQKDAEETVAWSYSKSVTKLSDE